MPCMKDRILASRPAGSFGSVVAFSRCLIDDAVEALASLGDVEVNCQGMIRSVKSVPAKEKKGGEWGHPPSERLLGH